MEKMAAVASSPSAVPYVNWEEVNVSSDRGRREVHYYLKRRGGVSDLAVVGKEKSLRHMSYHFVLRSRSVFSTSFSSLKLKSRREVIDWLNSVVTGPSNESDSLVDGLCARKGANNIGIGSSEEFQYQRLGQYTKEFLWLGSSWTCRKKKKHYQSFQRNGVIISVYDFVYVLAEEDKRLVAYLEDMYEDSRNTKMVVVRWFHKIDEVGLVLPLKFNDREIFFSLCLQDLSIECIDGLATVLSPQHFEKFLSEARPTHLEPYMCRKKFENDDVKPFDVTEVEGYWRQDIFRHLHMISRTKNSLSCQQLADNIKADGNASDGVGVRPWKRLCRSRDDDKELDSAQELLWNTEKNLRDHKSGAELSIPNGSSSSLLTLKEVKQNSSPELEAGSYVEVLSQDSGIRGCWFRALIIKKRKDKVKVQYQDIQDAADEACKLEEWILASRVAVPDKLGIRMLGRTTIRPSPESSSGKVTWIINVGSIVDVWWHDGWWEGIVVKKDSVDKLHVYLPGEKQEVVFGHSNVRHSREWMGNGWMHIKEKPELVTALLSCPDGSQDMVKSSDRSSVQATTCNSSFCGKDDAKCDYSPERLGGDKANEVRVVPDLSKDDLLSRLKWKSSRKRQRGSSNQKPRWRANDTEGPGGLLGSATCERFLIPSSLKVDHDNCKYIGDSLFSSVVSPLTSLVMSR